MRIIGLTGSIGMGKSTTADMFRERNIPVFCADQAVHELYTKDQELIGQMASMFENITNADGINRQKLSEHLRKDPKRLRDVERLVHPRVRRMREEYVEIWQNEGRPLCVFDIPLFFETGAKHEVDLVMVCSAPRIIQFERVMARPGMTLQNFLMILGRQMPDAEKRRHADLVVMTDLGMDHARQRLHACIETLDDGHA
tara:strand:- start:373 stop:969 length:597 start_codon:yes stop_codon:yes gene_type:complete